MGEVDSSNKNVAAERAVLAGLYTYGSDAYLDVAPMLTPLSFTELAGLRLPECYAIK